MRRGVLQAMLATIAVAQRHSQGLLWIVAAMPGARAHWLGSTELLNVQGDLQLQALLDLAAGINPDWIADQRVSHGGGFDLEVDPLERGFINQKIVASSHIPYKS